MKDEKNAEEYKKYIMELLCNISWKRQEEKFPSSTF